MNKWTALPLPLRLKENRESREKGSRLVAHLPQYPWPGRRRQRCSCWPHATVKAGTLDSAPEDQQGTVCFRDTHPADQSEQTTHTPGEVELLQEAEDKPTRESHMP